MKIMIAVIAVSAIAGRAFADCATLRDELEHAERGCANSRNPGLKAGSCQLAAIVRRDIASCEQAEASRKAAVARNIEKMKAEAAAQEAMAAEIQTAKDSAKHDPAKLRLIYGATFCAMQSIRAAALAEIAKEKKYATLGGVIDKQKLYSLQLQVRHADEVLSGWHESLREHAGLKAASCGDPEVHRLLSCRQGGECADGDEVLISLMASNEPADE